MGNRMRLRSLLELLDRLPSWLGVFLGLGSGLSVGVLVLGAGEPRTMTFLGFAAAIGFFGLLAWSGEPVLADSPGGSEKVGEERPDTA